MFAKIICMLILIFILLLLLILPVQADMDNPEILKSDSSSKEIVELKNNLKILGYIKESIITEAFDDITKVAILLFQKEYGIAADGIVGPETLKVLKVAIAQKELLLNGKPEDKETKLSDRGAINRIAATATKYAGVKYVSGGASPKGFDCSGFTQYVLKNVGIEIKRTQKDQFKQGSPVNRTDLQAGDLVFFRGSKSKTSHLHHVGIYLGGNEFIHASSTKRKVVVADFNQYCGWSYYAGARRFELK